MEQYYQAALKHIAHLASTSPWRELDYSTVFFGGGTPSLLPASMLTDILRTLRDRLSVAADAEVSIEVNPATIDLHGLLQLRRGGFNRISIGFQSLDDQQLQLIGRPHSAKEALEAHRHAREAGFANISIDMMYGLPTQSPQQWDHAVKRVLELDPHHLSLYELTLEQGTPLCRAVDNGTLTLPPEDALLRMMESTANALQQTPFTRYEISNYAKDGFRCRHNLNYWYNGSYLGIGPGAVSAHGGKRWATREDLTLYVNTFLADQEYKPEREELNKEQYFRETVMIGLRMTGGVDVHQLQHRFQLDPVAYYGATLTKLINQGLLLLDDGGKLMLTGKGLPLANAVMAELV